VGTRPDGRCGMRLIPDNYRLQIITKRSIFDGEMYSTICVEWTGDHFSLDSLKSIHFRWRYAREQFLHFRSP